MRFFHLLVQSTEEAQELVDSLTTGFTQKLKNISSMTFDDLLHSATQGLIHFGIKLVICLAVFWIGKKLIGFLSKTLRRIMDRRHVDPSVSHFLTNLLRAIFWIILIWILIAILGINTSSIVALFASAGLAFGLALSGTLQNFAGGVMILLFKPFRVGDYVASQGQEGTVTDITIINTILTTPDNRTIYLPNGATFSGIVNNTSQQRTRRLEWIFSIGYGDSYDRAKKLLMELIGNDKRILNDPAPFIALSKLGESSVDIVVRAWVNSGDYWGVFYDLNERVYKTFPAANLSIPFPQMDVYLRQPETPTDENKEAISDSALKEKIADTEKSIDTSGCQNDCDDSAKPSGGETGK